MARTWRNLLLFWLSLLLTRKRSNGWPFCTRTLKRNCVTNSILLSSCQSISDTTNPHYYFTKPLDRRDAIASGIATVLSILVAPKTVQAATVDDSSSWSNLRSSLIECITTLETLLDNWKNAVVDCRFADVPRELLETKNKELLLEKASTFALFDKSVSVETCQTKITNVRDYLGTTGIGPMAKLNDLLNAIVRTSLLLEENNNELIDVDGLIERTERVQRDLGTADSLAYSARRDFGSLNNFEKSEIDRILNDETTNLFKARNLIRTIVTELQEILQMLPTQQ